MLIVALCYFTLTTFFLLLQTMWHIPIWQMSNFYPEHEEYPHHGQDRAAIGRNPASEAVHTPTHERAVTDDMPSPSESGGLRRGRYMETEETRSTYRETDKGDNIACIILPTLLSLLHLSHSPTNHSCYPFLSFPTVYDDNPVQGSFHQNSVRFCAATRGHQCFPSCAFSLAYAKFQRHLSRCTSADFDFVLTTGEAILGTLLIQKPNLGCWLEMSDVLAPFLVDTSIYGGLNFISGYGIRSSLDEVLATAEKCIGGAIVTFEGNTSVNTIR